MSRHWSPISKNGCLFNIHSPHQPDRAGVFCPLLRVKGSIPSCTSRRISRAFWELGPIDIEDSSRNSNWVCPDPLVVMCSLKMTSWPITSRRAVAPGSAPVASGLTALLIPTRSWAEDIQELVAASGCNYVICSFAWGTLSFKQSLRSLRLFAQEVMPAFLTT